MFLGKRVPIILSYALISTFLDLPSEGSIIHPETIYVKEGFNNKQVYISLCSLPNEKIIAKKQWLDKGASINKHIISARNMFLEDKILQYILCYKYLLCYLFIPKSSNFSQISEFELHILFSLKNKIPFNWVHNVKTTMLISRGKTNRLLYAWKITKIDALNNFDLRGELKWR